MAEARRPGVFVALSSEAQVFELPGLVGRRGAVCRSERRLPVCFSINSCQPPSRSATPTSPKPHRTSPDWGPDGEPPLTARGGGGQCYPLQCDLGDLRLVCLQREVLA